MAYIPNEKTSRTIKKYPLPVLVGISCALLTLFINKQFSTSDGRNSDCKETIEYMREESEKKDVRIASLENTVNDYTRAVLFKDAQLKTREHVIDSLKKEVIR